MQGNSKPFWDVEEDIGFTVLTAKDNMKYKVWNDGPDDIKQQVAEELAKVRRDFNKLLIYLCKNPDLWINRPIAWGVIHTFDIHIPCLGKNLDAILKSRDFSSLINNECVKMNKLFNIQEMTPNNEGIIGLNKPKVITNITNGKLVDYPIATQRSMFLTIRNKKMDSINNYNDTILPLALHEISHTTCNDVTWKEDNHRAPYPSYHAFMRKCAKDCGILK